MKMEEFVSDANCVYAVLSHTWGEEEVSFQQYSTPEAHSMAGYRKIECSCALASRSELPYLWIDTCCIDKSSSAELSEAINSMYRWYRDAAVCYVHLSDMKRCEDYQNPLEDGPIVSTNYQMLQACRWFTRGWTLQELLAPHDVEFYDQDWVLIGTKGTMRSLLSGITGIKPGHLWKSQEASVAQKMSWAANRQTTRTEDVAYSLLGLFNVNMPLLYGEGEKALKRLQHEILQSTSDESIFAWTDDRVWTSGLLAESPANFAKSGDFIPNKQFYRKPYTMTNQGLQIELRHSYFKNDEAGRFETPLRCTNRNIWPQRTISLGMTYYTDETGALRALRTAPFEVGTMEDELLRVTKSSDSFHIDEFRRPKLPPHAILSTEVSGLESLSLRLSGGLNAREIYVSKSTGMMREQGFYILDRNEKFPLYETLPKVYVDSSYHDDPTCLMFDFRPFCQSGSARQGFFSPNINPSSAFKLQAGNSLATRFSRDKILFIALSRLGPLGQARIDIQLERVKSKTEGLLQLLKADPVRAHKDYLNRHSLAAFNKIPLPSEEGSGQGQVMYGQDIYGIDPRKS